MKKPFNANKIIAALCLFALVLSFPVCAAPEDKVASSLGKYNSYEFFTSGGSQDYTDYAKYSYSSIEIEDNEYLKKVEETDLEIINEHLDDFEKWIRVHGEGEPSSELVENYDFDRDCLGVGDYFYMESEDHTWSDGHTSLVKYNVYLFDVQTQILYYFHNNI